MKIRVAALLTSGLLYGAHVSSAQTSLPPDASARSLGGETRVTYIEQQAQFPGVVGQWLGRHLRYPEFARINGMGGKTYIRFIVDTGGFVTSAEVVRSSHSVLDKEALRVVRQMPRWTPGTSNGQRVRSYFTLPVVFSMENSNPLLPPKLDSCSYSYHEGRDSIFSKYPEYRGSLEELLKVKVNLQEGDRFQTVYTAVTISKKGQISQPHALCTQESDFAGRLLRAFESTAAMQNQLKKWRPALDANGDAVDCILILPLTPAID